MNSISEIFLDFWEVLTGVFDDNKSKIIRLTCFTLLAFGAAWAALNYFQADRLANTEVEIYRESRTETHRDDTALKRMVELARTVQDMRQGGEAIARLIASAHTNPFNTEGYNDMGLEDLGESRINSTGNNFMTASEDVQPADEFQPPQILVRAVIMSGKKQAAVIDMEEEKGILIRRGDMLPYDLGRITKIRADGITARIDGHEVKYELSEIENKLKKKKSNTNNNTKGRQTQLGVEKFLFEGTVPDNSPLAPTVSLQKND